MAARFLTSSMVMAMSLLVITIMSSGSQLAYAIMLRLRFIDLKANYVGDPEKAFMDSCLRDYEAVSSADPRFKDARKDCIRDLVNSNELKRLPRIRPTVDEGICDQSVLCEDSDPGQCEDEGNPRDAGYQAGDVTRCFRMIETATKELEPVRHSSLLDEAEKQCTRSGRWKDYSNQVQLQYCMWKQITLGACTNNLRSNCPGDSSCCPVAQNYLDPELIATLQRSDFYVCRKSPIVGLYCQHLEDRVPTGNSSITGDMCTDATCPSFDWCADFADIPGECMGKACQGYQNALMLTLVCVIAAAAGVVFDMADVLLLLKCPTRPRPRVMADGIATCLKVVAVLICYTGDISEFADEAAAHACFYNEGGKVAESAKAAAGGFMLTALLSAASSCISMPLSMRVGGQLTKLPYARVK